jgi:hypothetical protein
VPSVKKNATNIQRVSVSVAFINCLYLKSKIKLKISPHCEHSKNQLWRVSVDYYPHPDKKNGHLMTTTLHSQPDLTQGATSATPPLLPPPGGPTAVFYEYPPYGDANHLGTPCSEHHYDVPLLAPPPKHPPPAAPGTASTASLASSTKPPQRSGSLSSFSSCEYCICILL